MSWLRQFWWAGKNHGHLTELMQKSEVVAETLGEQVFNYVLLNKKRDWMEYRAQVTPYELSSNLELL
jgi:glutamine synthetase